MSILYRGQGTAFFENGKWYVSPVHIGAPEKLLVTSGAPRTYEGKFNTYYVTMDNINCRIWGRP